MSRKRRVYQYVLVGLLAGLAIGALLVYVLTRTEFGVEQVRRIAIARIQDRIQGELRVERITSGGLLRGATLHGIAVDDPQGRPFLRADSARLTYDWRTLLAGQIVFNRLDLFNPEIVLERLPGDTAWNFERIFPDTTPDDEPDRLIQIDRVRIYDGTLALRMPWEPDVPIEPEDTARVILRAVPGGTVREFRFEDLNAVAPRVLWETPVEEGRLIQVASLSTRGYIWEDPFDLRDFEGTVTIRDSVVSFDAERFQLPESRGSAIGQIVFGDEETRYDIRIQGDQVRLADLQWLYPPLPAEGGGSLVFRIQSLPQGTLWLVQDARVQAPGTEIAGTFGIVTGDTLYFTQVNLRASPLNLALIESLLPVDLPIEGILVGTVEVEGLVSSLETRGELRLVQEGRASDVRWSGTFDLAASSLAVTDLRADLKDLDLALLSVFGDGARFPGRVSGRVEATGRLDRTLAFSAALEHAIDGETPSVFRAAGSIGGVGRTPTIDVELDAQALILDEVARSYPALDGLTGVIAGPVKVSGPLSDLAVHADLTVPEGQLVVEGRADLTGSDPRYRLEGEAREVRLEHLIAGVPGETLVSGGFVIEGAGVGPETAQATLHLDLGRGSFAAHDVRGGSGHLSVRDGVLHVDSLVVRTEAGLITAKGDLGLVEGRRGTLELRANAAALETLQPIFFPDAPFAMAADTGRYRVGGSAQLEARIAGSIHDLEARGRVRATEILFDRVRLRRATVTFAAAGVGTDAFRYEVGFTADSLRAPGRLFATVEGNATYAEAGGQAEIEAHAILPEPQHYRVVSDFRHDGLTATDFDLLEVYARTGAGEWELAEPAGIRVATDGLRVTDLLLRQTDGSGQIRADGHLAWRADSTAADLPAAFRLDLVDVPVVALRPIETAEPTVAARMSGSAVVGGTAGDPRIDAEMILADVRVGAVRFESLEARAAYADRLLEATVSADREGKQILSGNGRIPIDLRLQPVDERRLDDRLDVEILADGVPAALFASLVRGFERVDGTVDGRLAIGGTTLDPALGGELTLTGGRATWAVSGVRYTDVKGTFRVLSDQLVDVALDAKAGDGRARVSGAITFAPISDPSFDLVLDAEQFLAARRRDVDLVGTGRLTLRGRYTRPEVTGALRVDQGTLYLDEIWRQFQRFSFDDPLLFDFAVLDTSAVSVRRLISASTNPFVTNLVADVAVDVGRGSWLKGRGLNIEVNGRLQVQYDRRAEDLRITGTLHAIRGGRYDLYLAEALPVRSFTVSQGTIEFDGTPGLNPDLDIVATHRVARQNGPLLVEAVVTGDLESPRVTLRSNEEPPISESDLLSYVIFGRPTYQLAGRESQQLGQANQLGIGVLTPSLFGFATLGLETFASNLGIADYIAVTQWEGDYDGSLDDLNAFERLYRQSQLEVGRYLGDEWYVAVTRRLNSTGNAPIDGGRLEWRFHPTWTVEFFFEDRFARAAGYVPDHAATQQKVHGFFLFREWGIGGGSRGSRQNDDERRETGRTGVADRPRPEDIVDRVGS